MTKAAKNILRHVYYQHGLFTFLLFFAPLIPGLIESHTRLYLKFTHALTGDAKNAQEAIQQMFGSRGLRAYEDFIISHPTLIRPSVIIRTIYESEALTDGLHLIEELFTSAPQRRYVNSDTFRCAIINELPRFFQAFNTPKYQSFRSSLIDLLIENNAVEKAIEPKIATAEICWELLQLTHKIEHARRHALEISHFNSLEASMKVKLVGYATASDLSYTKLYDVSQSHKHLLTQVDINKIKDILFTLYHDKSPEVNEPAQAHSRNLQALTLSLN